MNDVPMPGHVWLIADLLATLTEEAMKKAREMNEARRFNRRRRVGATLRPGNDTPLWDELRRAVQASVRVRGEQVKLARVLGLPRQQVNSFLTRGTRMPDAERTLLLMAWLIAKREGRPLS